MESTDYKQVKARYTYLNPPPTIHDAVQRVEELNSDITRVNADLESRTERDLGTPDHYDNWKFRATRAREHMRQEKRYLLQWVEKKTRESETKKRLTSEKAKGAELSRLVEDFLRSASPYRPLPESEQTSDERKVLERRVELGDIKQQYVMFLSFLKGESVKIECPLPSFLKARAPVAKIVQNIEVELVELKKSGSLESRFSHSHKPKPTGDARLSGINSEINVLKKKLQMSSAEMTIWVIELIGTQGTQLPLTEAQVATLDLIKEYTELTKQRIAIEYET